MDQENTFRPQNQDDHASMQWLAVHAPDILRWALGLVFLAFGLLKFFPDMSPAEDLSVRTMDQMTFGLITGDVARILIAAMETVIGLTLLTGKFVKVGLALLAIATIGILAPLFLFTGELFSGKHHAPTIAAQYCFKDIVLAASALVVFLRSRGVEMSLHDSERPEAR